MRRHGDFVASLSESDLLASPLEDFADASEVMALLSELLTMSDECLHTARDSHAVLK